MRPQARGATHSVSVPHEPHGVSLARHAFADELGAAGLTDDVQDDAMLVLSELVSNAVNHAEALPDGDLLVRWSIDDRVLHIDVTDGGATTRPNAVVAAVSAMGGRGLDIVRTVSRQWGVTEASDSVTVWADLGCTTLAADDRPTLSAD